MVVVAFYIQPPPFHAFFDRNDDYFFCHNILHLLPHTSFFSLSGTIAVFFSNFPTSRITALPTHPLTSLPLASISGFKHKRYVETPRVSILLALPGWVSVSKILPTLLTSLAFITARSNFRFVHDDPFDLKIEGVPFPGKQE